MPSANSKPQARLFEFLPEATRSDLRRQLWLEVGEKHYIVHGMELHRAQPSRHRERVYVEDDGLLSALMRDYEQQEEKRRDAEEKMRVQDTLRQMETRAAREQIEERNRLVLESSPYAQLGDRVYRCELDAKGRRVVRGYSRKADGWNKRASRRVFGWDRELHGLDQAGFEAWRAFGNRGEEAPARRHKRDELYSRPDLKARGWTDGLIAKFLPIPDDLRDNPHYKNSPPMSLYLRTRVEQIEQDDAFKAAMLRTEARKDGARQAVATKAATIKARCEQAEINVEVASYAEVKRLSMATHGGNYEGEPGEWYWSYRTAMNCVRHCLTNYEALWALCNRGFTGQDGYEVLRDRVDQEIMRRYPWLRSEEAFIHRLEGQ